jgi:sulfur-oxidizing protein SoxX
MMKIKQFQGRILLVVSAVAVAGCAAMGAQRFDVSAYAKASFAEKGAAKLDRLEQSELQRTCSEYTLKPLPDRLRAQLEKQELARVKYPADGKYLGDWKQGETIAQSGRGLQFSDGPNTVAGGNCYACHQLTKTEVSHGTIGPSLYQYGKLRGQSEPILKYTWGKLWNAHAFNACTNMPRFGDAGILTESQLRHVMALLLDPASPVNR